MRDEPDVRILILTDQPSHGLCWAAMLQPIAQAIWLNGDTMPRESLPDVIVTDALPTFAAAIAAWNCSVLQIGGQAVISHATDNGLSEDVTSSSNATGPFDNIVNLPGDVTARELQIACRLAASLSRVRRRLDVESTLHRRFRSEALTDPLTGLFNRRAWDDVLRARLEPDLSARQDLAQGNESLQRSEFSKRRRICLAILDLDHFKQINDIHGHVIGDAVLRETGKTIIAAMRQEDLIARLGGDEFGVLCEVADRSSAEKIMERVRTLVPSELAQRALPAVTISIGYCLMPGDDVVSLEASFAAADAALRSAKHQGRNRTQGAAQVT
jgi:diguanylate cyclase (GGDEF)-like protein